MNNTAPVTINSGAATAASSKPAHHEAYVPAIYGSSSPFAGSSERVREALGGFAVGVRFESPRGLMGRKSVNRS